MKKSALITLLSLGTLASTAWAADHEVKQAPKATAADIKALNDARDDWNKMQKTTNKDADSKVDVFSNHKNDSHALHSEKDVSTESKPAALDHSKHDVLTNSQAKNTNK